MRRWIAVAIVLGIGATVRLAEAQSYTFSHVAGPYGGSGAEDGRRTVARFSYPQGIAIGADGVIYVADTSNGTIRTLTPDGDVSTLAGQAGHYGGPSVDGTGEQARFYSPTGIAVAADGTLFVVDVGTSRIRKVTALGDVTTIAGAFEGFADGVGTAALFRGPRAIAAGPDGRLYVADTENHVVRCVTVEGVVTTLAGQPGEAGYADGLGSAARFAQPYGIAVDANGNIYVADTSNQVIRRVSPVGDVSTLAGRPGVRGWADGTGSDAQFDTPKGIAVDANGGVIVTDVNQVVRRVSASGTVTTLAGVPRVTGFLDGAASEARFNDPVGVAVDAFGSILVADSSNQMIRRVAAATVTTVAGLPAVPWPYGWADGLATAARFGSPAGLSIDRRGNLWIADSGISVIRRISPLGEVTTPIGSIFTPGWLDGDGAIARFDNPTDVVASPDGVLFVSDSANCVIRKVTPSYVVSTLAGSPRLCAWADGHGASARFAGPSGLALAADGTLYVADARNHVIRRVTGEGDVTTLAGLAGQHGFADGEGSAARFNVPAGLAVDRDGNVYVADQLNQAVRRITPGGIVTTVAGQPGPQLAIDGPRGVARFVEPLDVAVSEAGDLIVSDMLYLNNALRRISPAGVVSTLAGGAGRGSTNGVAERASFAEARGLAFDGNGTLLIADTGNQVIRKGVPTRYLAEGASSAIFETRLALFNPSSAETTAVVRYLRQGQAPVAVTARLLPRQRVTIDPATTLGAAPAEFSTTVDAGEPLVVDRTVSWAGANAYGAHAETAVRAPSLTWYLAEGATHSGMQLFYLLQNPNATSATVRVRFLRPSGAPLEKSYSLPPQSRTNLWVNVEDFPGLGAALSGTDVSAVVDVLNDQPIIVERALYLDVPGQFFGAGHDSMGVTVPSTEWFLAEGATGSFFDLFVLIANPGDAEAHVEATYLLPGGATVVKSYTVAANRRFNIWVDRDDPRLADTAVSTTIRSTNGVPVIVERALWWPEGGWYEAHNTPGATTTGTLWAVAEGELDAARGLETYFLVANTSATPANVRVTLYFADGATASQTYADIAPRSRFNVAVAAQFAEAAGKRFSATIESVGADPAPIVVERAMYWDAAGQAWAAGTNALATKLR